MRDKLSDGLEAELYALLEKLGTAKAERAVVGMVVRQMMHQRIMVVAGVVGTIECTGIGD